MAMSGSANRNRRTSRERALAASLVVPSAKIEMVKSLAPGDRLAAFVLYFIAGRRRIHEKRCSNSRILTNSPALKRRAAPVCKTLYSPALGQWKQGNQKLGQNRPDSFTNERRCQFLTSLRRSKAARTGRKLKQAWARSVRPSRASMASSFSRSWCKWRTSDAAYSTCASDNSAAPQSDDCCAFDKSTPSNSRVMSLSPCRSV